MSFTWKENLRVLKYIKCLQIVLFLKKRSIFIFAYGKAGWVSSSQNWPFFVEIINVWPLARLQECPKSLYILGEGFTITLKSTSKSILLRGSFDPNCVKVNEAVIFPWTPKMYDIAQKCYRYDFFLLFLKI